MIQSISNNVNFGNCNVHLGGKSYSDIKKLSINIAGVKNTNVQQALQKNLSKLKKEIAEIAPNNADLSLIVNSKATKQGDKVKLTLQDNSDLSSIFNVSRAFSKNGRTSGVKKLFSNAKNKATEIFASQQPEIGTQTAKHIDLSI